MINFLFGLTIGIIGIVAIWLAMDSSNNPTVETRQCMTQQVHLLNPTANSSSPFVIIGEAVICAKDWQISNIYGPYAETFYGRIKLRDWDVKEFIEEEDNN